MCVYSGDCIRDEARRLVMDGDDEAVMVLLVRMERKGVRQEGRKEEMQM